jgi:acyl carrier protein
MSTFERLVKVCAAVFDDDIDISAIKPESNLITDINMNSIGILYMALAIEEEFGIKFSNEDFSKIATVEDVITVIEKKADL